MRWQTTLALAITAGGLIGGWILCEGNGFFAGGYFIGYIAASVSILLQAGTFE